MEIVQPLPCAMRIEAGLHPILLRIRKLFYLKLIPVRICQAPGKDAVGLDDGQGRRSILGAGEQVWSTRLVFSGGRRTVSKEKIRSRRIQDSHTELDTARNRIDHVWSLPNPATFESEREFHMFEAQRITCS